MRVLNEQSVFGKAETESKEVACFRNSLQELRDLRSQLHQAADFSEKFFVNAEQKSIVIDNTKEYICRAMVTVVDHLGCVATNLNCSFSATRAISDAELRINCLKQKLLSCEQYAHKLALTRISWRTNLPILHRRYLSASNAFQKSDDEDISDCNSNFNSSLQASTKSLDNIQFDEEDLPLFLYTCTEKPPSSKSISDGNLTEKDLSLVPVRGGLSIGPKTTNSTFHFQQAGCRHGRYSFFRRPVHTNNFFSRIRRVRRTTI